MKKFPIAFTIFLSFLDLSASENILALASGSSTSHHQWNKVVFNALAARKHNVTVFSPDVDDSPPSNLHYIHAEQVYPFLYNGSSGVDIIKSAAHTSISSTPSFYHFGNASCTGFYLSEGFRSLLNYPKSFKFDLILVDYIFEPCLLGFIHTFGYPPVVAMTPFSVPPYTYNFIGGHTQPSYVPHVNTGYNTNMNFLQRVHNFLVYAWADWYRKTYFIPSQEKAMKKAFRDPTLPGVEELQRSVVLALTNTHFSIEKMEPLPPNVIPVGGLQIVDPKPLSEELSRFIESAPKGAVLFSLGTIVRSELMDSQRKQAFLEAFKKFPDFHFIWKYESDLETPLPPNVKTLPWISQNDILAHPRVRAFISHCGLMGTQEAIYHGVPVIGIPFYSDQHRNLQNGIQEGTSVKLDYFTLTTETIEAALREVLENPEYLKNARRRSRIMKDQPEKPIDRAVFWIEWAMRHRDDYQAIQLPIKELGYFVSKSYDVIAFLAVLVFFVVRVLVWGLTRVLWSLRRGEK